MTYAQIETARARALPPLAERAPVFVTGATGYIGGVVAQRLVSAGHAVLGLVRTREQARAAARRGIIPRHGDLSDEALLRSCVSETSAVVHTAAAGPMPEPDLESQLQRSARALRVLADASRSERKRFITTSGASFHGDTGSVVVPETRPVPEVAPFGALARLENSLSETENSVVVRAAFVYGRAGSKPVLFAARAIKERGQGLIVRDDNRITTCHVDDLADLYYLALTASGPPPVLHGASSHVPFIDLMRALAARYAPPGELERVEPAEAIGSLSVLGFYAAQEMRLSHELTSHRIGWAPHRAGIIDEIESGSYAYATEEDS